MTAVSVPIFRVDVIDPVTGAKVVENLPHLHGLDFEKRGMVPGASGQNLVGGFNVPLHPPGTPGYKLAVDDYAKLKYNQRIEIRLGDVAGGDPKFTGVIRGLPRGLDNYKITGVDSLNLLQQARTGRTEYLKATTDQVAALGLRAYQKVFGDSFDNKRGTLAANYTATGAWTSNVADEGLTTATISDTAADDYLISTATYAAASYADCVVRCWFHIKPTSTIGSTTKVGIVAASDSGAANLTEGQVLLKCISATEWDIDVVLNTKAASAYTSPEVKRLNLVFNMPTNLFRCQLSLVGKKGTFAAGTFTPSPTGPDYMWRVLVNGVDSNCYAILMATAPSGRIGLHWNSATGTAPQLWANRLAFRNRANVFQQGSVWTAGVRSLAQYFSRVPMLDVLTTAAVTEGSVIAKREKGGLNNDQIDFGPVASVARDYSGGQVILEEQVNLTAGSLEPLAETPASEIELQLSPGADNAGSIDWDNFDAQDAFGILTDSVAAQNISDFLAARVLADSLSQIKGNPGQAKKATVALDIDTAWKYEPLDYVAFTSARLGLYRAKVQVVALKYTEGKPTVDATFDSYPIDATELQMRRMWATIDALAAGVASLSPTQGQGTVYDNAYGAPNVMTCYSGYWPVDATHNLQLVFGFPRNIVMIQKVTLSFFLFAYLGAMAATTAGTTSGAGSSHAHSVPSVAVSGVGSTSADMNHTHAFPYSGAAIVNALGTDATSTQLQWGGAGAPSLITSNSFQGGHTHSISGQTTSSTTSGSDSTHSHSVPSASLGAPTGLQAGAGGATGAHVIVDGVDRTTALGGPWTTDQLELDITQFVLGGGKHKVEVTSTALGGEVAQIQAFTLAKST